MADVATSVLARLKNKAAEFKKIIGKMVCCQVQLDVRRK